MSRLAALPPCPAALPCQTRQQPGIMKGRRAASHGGCKGAIHAKPFAQNPLQCRSSRARHRGIGFKGR